MKDHWKRLTALLLALMLLCGLMGCGEASSSGKDEQGEDPAPAEQTEEASPAETAGEDAAREQTDSAPEDTAQDPLTEPAEAPDGETEEQKAFRLRLTKAANTVLGTALKLICIRTPEKI